MKIVVITAEKMLPDEAGVLNRLLDQGVPVLHLRKPGASEQEVRESISGINPEFRDRIVLHDNFGLVREFGLRGVHLNSRNPQPPQGFSGHISRSCHTLDEVAEAAGKYDYVFLSPVFDSISKEGYGSRFSRQELLAAKEKGIIDKKVYALGGVDENNIQDAARIGFGGVAILGALWGDFLRNSNESSLSERWNALAAKARAICGVCSL